MQASGSLFHCEGDEFAKRLDYSGLVIHNINRVESDACSLAGTGDGADETQSEGGNK